jgi:Tfp pilus assembly protein PilF
MARSAGKALTAAQAVREAQRLVREVWRDLTRWNANYRRVHRLVKTALVKEPRHTLLLTALGTMLCDMGRHREATTVLQRAIALGAKDRHTVFNLAVATLNAGHHDPAMTHFRKAGMLKPRSRTWEAYFDPHGH